MKQLTVEEEHQVVANMWKLFFILMHSYEESLMLKTQEETGDDKK